MNLIHRIYRILSLKHLPFACPSLKTAVVGGGVQKSSSSSSSSFSSFCLVTPIKTLPFSKSRQLILLLFCLTERTTHIFSFTKISSLLFSTLTRGGFWWWLFFRRWVVVTTILTTVVLFSSRSSSKEGASRLLLNHRKARAFFIVFNKKHHRHRVHRVSLWR